MDLKLFQTKNLLLSFQVYQIIVNEYDMLLWRITLIAHTGCCMRRGGWGQEHGDGSAGKSVRMGAQQWEHWDRRVGIGSWGGVLFPHSHLHVPIPKASPHLNWNTATFHAWWWECGDKRWGWEPLDVSQELRDGGIEVGSMVIQFDKYHKFQLQIMGKISQFSIVQSASLMILCYSSIRLSWVIPLPSLWVLSYSFHS